MGNGSNNTGKRKAKWLKEILFLLAILAISAAVALLLIKFQRTFEISLRGYGWVAYLVVFGANLLSSASIFIPAPGIAFTLAASAVWDPMFVALAAGTGDALGEMSGYWVGYVGEQIIVDENLSVYRKARAWMDKYGIWAVLAVALVPIMPYDLIGMSAGALKIKWWKFFLATWVGKLERAFVVSYFGFEIPVLIQSLIS